jgi:hypothetical protein|uniref:Uncharacterized protein n=1 Tax=viral metagenome TaxID=1070528 RepID=A0A6C0C0K6_9ZZZZ
MENNLSLENLNIDTDKLTKMIFIFNALENGWTIKKRDKNYLFRKKHEGKKEIFSSKFLPRFLEKNFDLNNFIFVEE